MDQSTSLEFEEAKKKAKELLNLRIEALQNIIAIQDSVKESLQRTTSKKEKRNILLNRYQK
jgi:hypothetical protein